MTAIPPIAWAAGLTASMLFMILGWPLANALSLLRILFDSFQMKLVLAGALGAASAPLAETHAPQLKPIVERLEDETRSLPSYIDRLKEHLS